MTNSEQIDNYLREVAASLNVDGAQRKRALEEIHSHLIDGTAENMRGGIPRLDAEALVIEELGSPDTVGAAFIAEATSEANRSGLLRWLPMALPSAMLTITLAVTGLTLISSRDGWTIGEREVLKTSLLMALIAGAIGISVFLSIQRADQDRNWRKVAWACSGAVILYFVLR